MPRTSEIARKTKETDIKVCIDLDGKGVNEINTGIGFFDHMLTALSKHSGIDMKIPAMATLMSTLTTLLRMSESFLARH